jgi:predicted permease
MSWISVAASRLRGMVLRERLDRDLDNEVRFHLEMQIEDNLKSGMDPEEARYAAMRSFGGVERMKETHREQRTFAQVETILQDLRYGLRTLRKSPGFTITAVLLLALAIGANTAMFSVLHAVLLRPLHYQAPEQLAMLWTESPGQKLREARSSLWDVEQWRRQSRSFVDIATFDTVAALLSSQDGVEQLVGGSVTPNLFPLLGVQPVLGRAFSNEDAEREHRLVLVSHRFWLSRFGGSSHAIGATLILNGLPNEIIGVLPPNFQLARMTGVDVWQPHTSQRAARGPETWFALGRLKPNVSFEQAQAEMSALARSLNEQLPESERSRAISVVGLQARLALWILGGAVFCVFLIAAANVTSLSLARSISRNREMAVRLSLGASTGRILRQLLTEGILLAAIAGVCGAGLALAGAQLIRAFGPANLPRLQEINVNLQALGCALAITLLAGMLVGLTPAIAVLRRRDGLRPSAHDEGTGSRSVASGTVATQRIRRGLVIADFALAIILLAGAGLLIRSWWSVNGVDPGFRPEQVLFVGLSAPPDLNTTQQRSVLYQRVLEAAQSVPGVEQAGIIGDLFIGNSKEQVVTVERNDGAITERFRFAAGEEVSPEFFKAMGTPLLRGRFFTSADSAQPQLEAGVATAAPSVAIINESFARRSWPGGQNPLGRRVKLGSVDSPNRWFTIVGVVGDMRRQGLEIEPFPQMFAPLSTIAAPRNIDLLLRISNDDPQRLMNVSSMVREAIRRVEKNAPVYGIVPLEQQMGAYLAQRRFQTWLLAGFSVVALLMAAVGIYGLIQYSIATRTQEIGIRLAIGAHAGEIFRMILGEGLKLSLKGLLFGLVGAFWLGQAGSSLLFGVTPADPWTFLAVSALLTLVALAACWLPARRAMKIEPVAALRQG